MSFSERDAGQATAGAPDERRIAFITCVDEPSRYRPCARSIDALDVPSGYSVEKVVVVGAPTTAAGYRVAMRASSAKYKVYLHPDVRLVHRGLLHELLRLFRLYPRLGMVAVRGATLLPPSGLWHDAGWRHRYGRVWEYRRPEGAVGQGGPIDRRRLRLVRHRDFVGDYLTAVAVDGMLVATQYDLEWDESPELNGLAEQAHALELIRAGYEVGIARQERVWCLRWTGRGERGAGRGGDAGRRAGDADRQVEAFRRRYREFIEVPAAELAKRYRPAAPAAGPAGERLGVVIVTFKGRDVLRRALASLIPQCEALDGLGWEIVVADNASGDGTVEMVRREFPMVAVLARESNDGPARAYNDGLRWLGVGGSVGASADGRGLPDYVLVMNNDVEFLEGTLARMVGYLREHPDVAGVVASLLNPDGTEQFQRMATIELVPRRPCRPAPITFIATGCVLLRGTVLWDVGLYDERFYFYNEDLEWSLRAKRKGYRFIFLPDAKVVHVSAVGISQNRRAIQVDLPSANLWYFYKHAGPRWAAAMYGAQRLEARWRARRHRGDGEALQRIGEAMARMEGLYRRLRERDRPPELLEA